MDEQGKKELFSRCCNHILIKMLFKLSYRKTQIKGRFGTGSVFIIILFSACFFTILTGKLLFCFELLGDVDGNSVSHSMTTRNNSVSHSMTTRNIVYDKSQKQMFIDSNKFVRIIFLYTKMI